jgi:hypothetical protein
MATTIILHVGEDLCQRIPVLETAGLVVQQTETDIPAIRAAFSHGDTFSAVLFHSDISAPSQSAARETRTLSQAPLVLFQNPAAACDENEFNLVIPPLTPPAVWLQQLCELIEQCRGLRERSGQLRLDCATIRSQSDLLRARPAHNRIGPIDPDALWNGETGAIPESKPPEEARPDEGAAKAG